MNCEVWSKIYLNTLIFLFIIYPETPNSSEDEDDNELDGDEGNGQCWRLVCTLCSKETQATQIIYKQNYKQAKSFIKDILGCCSAKLKSM